MTNPVPELIKLVGPAVFIAWPRGVKGTKKRWKHLTIADMTTEYLAKLKDGNIGVALGEVSGGLCAIDWDMSQFVELFLEINPHLSGTLQTHGTRGRVFWLRLNGDYPKRTVKLKAQSGEDIGEFRSNGAQSIVWGIHPDTQKPYEFVVREPVVEIEFNSIKWPTEVSNPPQCTEEDRRDTCHYVASVSSVSSGASVSSVHGWSFRVRTLEDAIRYSAPTRKQQNNHLLFVLARGVKALEAQQDRFTPKQLREAFDRWYTGSLPFLRVEQTKEEYFMEFLNAYRGGISEFGASVREGPSAGLRRQNLVRNKTAGRPCDPRRLRRTTAKVPDHRQRVGRITTSPFGNRSTAHALGWRVENPAAVPNTRVVLARIVDIEINRQRPLNSDGNVRMSRCFRAVRCVTGPVGTRKVGQFFIGRDHQGRVLTFSVLVLVERDVAQQSGHSAEIVYPQKCCILVRLAVDACDTIAHVGVPSTRDAFGGCIDRPVQVYDFVAVLRVDGNRLGGSLFADGSRRLARLQSDESGWEPEFCCQAEVQGRRHQPTVDEYHSA